MRYMLLIYTDEKLLSAPDSEETRQMMPAYAAFTDELSKSGAMQSGDALQPVATSTSVRVRNGERLTIDGPFAETKEQLGGFYIVNCASADEALGWAAKVPGARHGTVEVRPIMEF